MRDGSDGKKKKRERREASHAKEKREERVRIDAQCNCKLLGPNWQGLKCEGPTQRNMIGPKPITPNILVKVGFEYLARIRKIETTDRLLRLQKKPNLVKKYTATEEGAAILAFT